MKEFQSIKYWLFDLDNTLYSGQTKVFEQVDKKMSQFISQKLNVDIKEAKIIQKNYFYEYNTTLNGLIKNHKIDANEFLDFVHDIYVDFFTDLVLMYSQKNINSLSEFIVWWEQVQDKKSITISEDTNAVKLMTIHKSKGLAFNIVMIPFNWESSAKKEMWVDNNNFNSTIFYIIFNVFG